MATAVAHAAPFAGSLIDQRGNAFSLESFRGHPVAITFVSARCTDACPLIDAQIAQAADLAKRRRSRMRFVTLTLDPHNDRVAQMRTLADEFHADPAYWRVATGSVRAIRALMRDFGVETQDDGHGYPEAHTTFVYVIDSSGRLTQTILPSSHLSDTLEKVAQR